MSLDNVIAPSSVSGWDIALSLLVLVGTWFAYRLTAKWVAAGVTRIGGMSDGVRLSIVRVAKYLVMFLGIGIALTFLGAQLQPVLTVVLIVGIIVALALRGIADNFGAGLILQTRKPIDVGDEIESQGYLGIVLDITGRSVEIETYDGRRVHLPNSEVLNEPLLNNTIHGARRSEVQVRCVPPEDLKLRDCLPVLVAAVGEAQGVLSSPAPDGLLLSADPRRLTMTIRFWHQPLDGGPVTSDVVALLGQNLRDRSWEATVTSQVPAVPQTPSDPI